MLHTHAHTPPVKRDNRQREDIVKTQGEHHLKVKEHR